MDGDTLESVLVTHFSLGLGLPKGPWIMRRRKSKELKPNPTNNKREKKGNIVHTRPGTTNCMPTAHRPCLGDLHYSRKKEARKKKKGRDRAKREKANEIKKGRREHEWVGE